MTWIVLLVFAIFAVSAERRRYDGCEVWQVNPTNSDQQKQLHALSKLHDSQEDNEIKFWENPGRQIRKSEILACQEGIVELKNFLKVTKIPAEVVSTNVQSELDDLWARNELRHRGGIDDYVEDDYNTFEDIISQLDVLQGNCPADLTCTVETIGTSTEGRPMVIFRMVQPGADRRALFFDSLTHAREWLSGATLMGILTKLINEYGTNPEATRLVDTYDFHVVPVVNPDGYVYSWTTDRFWRKSRIVNDGSSCLGTDLNRNFDFGWGEPGSSTNPCSESYRGPFVASDPETRTIQDAGEALRGRIALWLTFHTFGEYYLFQYALVDENSQCRRSPDHDDIDRAAQAARNAIQETFNVGNWVAGTSCEVLGLASGNTQDWAYGVGLAKYSYTPELRGPGFTPDRSNIEPSIAENWNGVVALVKEIEDIEGY